MPEATVSGAEFKKQLREGQAQDGPVPELAQPDRRRTAGPQRLRLAARGHTARSDGLRKTFRHARRHLQRRRKSMVRVGGYDDRPGIQQALDMGADGVLVPYINTAEEARQAVSCTKYPTAGTRSVYFPQRSMNQGGLLGYAGNFNNNGIVALQVETASCIENIAEIAAVPGVDILFLGQNDLCMSMGLYEKYEFPHMYTSPELGAATKKLVDNAAKNNVILGMFLFGTSRVGRISGEGLHLHQRRKRSAPRPDAGRRVRQRHGEHRQGKRQELEAPPDGAVLGLWQRLCADCTATVWSRASRPRCFLSVIPRPRASRPRPHKHKPKPHIAGAWIPISLPRLICCV